MLGSSTLKTGWQREAVIAAIIIGLSLLALPFIVYLVGARVIGDYSPDAGALGLAEHFWTDLLHLRPPAWLFALSPYLVIQLARLAWRAPRL